jgi:hypothetical protein
MNFFSVNLFQISYENLVIMKNEQPIFKKMASSFFLIKKILELILSFDKNI